VVAAQSAISKLTAIVSLGDYNVPPTLISIISYLRILHTAVPSLVLTVGA